MQKDKSDTYKIVRFEDLRNNSGIYKDICHEFNLKTVENLDDVYGKPSSKAHARGLKGDKPQNSSMNQEEIKNISIILNKFNLKFYPLENWKV